MPLRRDERILVRVSQSRKVTDFIEGHLLVLLRTDVLFHPPLADRVEHILRAHLGNPLVHTSAS